MLVEKLLCDSYEIAHSVILIAYQILLDMK